MNKLKFFRKKNNYSQEDVAKKLGLQGSAISKYECGRVPLTDDVIIKLCDLFNCTADELLGYNDKKISEIEYVPVYKNFTFKNFTNNELSIIREIPVSRKRFKNTNSLFFKEVTTREMEPLILKGDLVLFEKLKTGDNIHAGDICLCTNGDNNAVIREMVPTTNGYVFNLMNVQMPPRARTKEKIIKDNINILARAIEILHELPDHINEEN